MSDMEPVTARHNFGTVTVVDRLVEHLRARDVASDRFEESATSYPGFAQLLRRSRPVGDLPSPAGDGRT
jgi:hypothetical protein